MKNGLLNVEKRSWNCILKSYFKLTQWQWKWRKRNRLKCIRNKQRVKIGYDGSE